MRAAVRPSPRPAVRPSVDENRAGEESPVGVDALTLGGERLTLDGEILTLEDP
jgi:hypothetical protein